MIDKTQIWTSSKYGRSHRTPSKHYRISKEKLLLEHPYVDIEKVDKETIFSILEMDLAEAHKKAVLEAFARHMTFVYDSTKLDTSAYINHGIKPQSPWDITKEMYYTLKEEYDCYSFEAKITLTIPNKAITDIDFLPIYADFDHSVLAYDFNKLPYIKLCKCEDKVNTPPLKDKNVCKIYCVNKHANIDSKFLSTRSLFTSKKYHQLFLEFYPYDNIIVNEIYKSIPSNYERALHLNAISQNKILERLSEQEFEYSANSGSMHAYRKIVKNIGIPSIKDFTKIVNLQTNELTDTQEIPVIKEEVI